MPGERVGPLGSGAPAGDPDPVSRSTEAGLAMGPVGAASASPGGASATAAPTDTRAPDVHAASIPSRPLSQHQPQPPPLVRTVGTTSTPATTLADLYTRLRPQYTPPIVSVNRGSIVRPAPPNASVQASPVVRPVAAAGAAATSTPPPFIVSNALAAASGLNLARRTTSTPLGPVAGAATPGAAPATRLPPHKDLLSDDAELSAQRARTQARIAQRLAHDHERVLRPDVRTPFRDARDVVDRLLPYHVWQVPDSDLVVAMGGKYIQRSAAATKASPDDAELSYAVPLARKRRALGSTCPVDAKVKGAAHAEERHASKGIKQEPAPLPDEKHPLATPADDVPDTLLALPPFPTREFTASVYAQRTSLARRFSALQTRSNSTHESAPLYGASIEHLERLVYEDEMKSFQDLSAELRRARGELEDLERQRNWRTGVPSSSLSAALGTSREWAPPYTVRRATPQGGSPERDDAQRTFPAVRPYGLDAARSGASLPALSHAALSHLAGLTASGARAPGGAAAAALQPTSDAQVQQSPAPTLTSSLSSSLSAPSIPSQPLPLVVPIAAVPRLTALGINLVPATHLLPALSLASAGQSVAMNPGLTAPRPVVGMQLEPVLLVGITDAPSPLPPGASTVSRQRLHLSVVLSKLRPDQLSGLAALMQTLQTEDERAQDASAKS